MPKTILSLAIAAALVAGPSFAADAPELKPPKGTAGELVDMWRAAGKLLLDVAEEFPESLYDYRATPEIRTFAEQLLHAAGGNLFFVELSRGKMPATDELPRAKYPTKAKVVEVLRQSIDAVCARIEESGDEGLKAAIKVPFGPPRMLTGAGYWANFRGHMLEHYGQLVVYYRLNKLVPPISRPQKKAD